MQLKFVPEILPNPLGRPRCRWVDNINPLEHIAVCEMAGLAKSVDTQLAVRQLRHQCLLLVILAFCQ